MAARINADFPAPLVQNNFMLLILSFSFVMKEEGTEFKLQRRKRDCRRGFCRACCFVSQRYRYTVCNWREGQQTESAGLRKKCGN
jgi:hypothetical protein